MIFLVSNKSVHANKVVLSMSSPVFSAMFSADYEESCSDIIPLPLTDYDEFIIFMKAVHPPFLKVEENNVEFLLSLAHEYQVQHVLNQCEDHLLTFDPDIDDLKLADMYGLHRFRQHCLSSLCCAPLDELLYDEDYKQLDPSTLNELITYNIEQQPPKELICELMSSPPSVKSLVLADEYNLPQLRQMCIEYVEDTTLAELEMKPHFKDVKMDTMVEVLYHKVKEFETASLKPQYSIWDKYFLARNLPEVAAIVDLAYYQAPVDEVLHEIQIVCRTLQAKSELSPLYQRM